MLLGEILERNSFRYPQEEALSYDGNRYTWQELNSRVNRLAAALSQRGVKKGDKIAFLLQNCNELVEIHFACAKLGAISVPLNYRLAGDELIYIVNDCDAKILFYGQEYGDPVGSIQEQLGKVEQYYQIGGEGDGYAELMAGQADAEPDPGVSEHEPVLILYTSGTTGRPKGAMLTHYNCIWNAVNMLIDVQFSHQDVNIVVPPLYHSAALNCWLLPHLFVASRTVILKDFKPAELITTILQEQVTNIFLVPAMYNFLLQVPGLENYQFNKVKLCATGASIMPIPVKEKIKKYFPEAGIVDVYGLTEAGPGVTILKPADAFGKTGSVGQPFMTLKVKVVDEEGNIVQPSQVGEILVKGPTIMQGYYKMPEASADSLAGGWLHTGDLATVDEEGYLYVVDRKKDMVNSGGENIYPAEVEAVIVQHPAVLEAACFGVPDEEWGETLKAAVVLKEGSQVTEQEIIDFVKERLASYKKPRSVDFLPQLPRNASGKVLKTVLRGPYWQGRERKV